MAPSDQRGPMAVAEIVAVFLGPRTGQLVPEFSQKWKENNDGTNRWEYYEPYVCLGVIVFKQVSFVFIYHRDWGWLNNFDAWNRLSSPTCQVRWNRFTCVERNSKLMPLRTRRVSPGKRLAANEKATWKNWPTAILAHWSCSQIPRPHQEEQWEYQMIQPLVFWPTYRSPDVCPSYVAFRIGALKLYINVDVEKYPATQRLVPSGSLQNYGVTVGPWHPWQPKDLRTSYYDSLLKEIFRIFNIRIAADSMRYHIDWLSSRVQYVRYCPRTIAYPFVSLNWEPTGIV